MKKNYVEDLDIRSAKDYVLLDTDGNAVLDSDGEMISLYEP